jgi:hypothetical protein
MPWTTDAIWMHAINIRPILESYYADDGPERVASEAHEICVLIRSRALRPWLDTADENHDGILHDVVQELEAITSTDSDVFESLNRCLIDLYDWADAARVWLGPFPPDTESLDASP